MWAADIILVIHLMFVLFVVGSLPLIWIGSWMRLSFVRNRYFRLAHLAAIAFVVGESLVGMMCPLTLLEDRLRGTASENGFVERWLHRIIFYDVPEGVLTVLYIVFALLVVITWRQIPPHGKRPLPRS